MADIQIRFPQSDLLTLGRNGYSYSCGLNISEWSIGAGHVTLEPINSRGEVGRARLVLPLSHVRELANALVAMLPHKTLSNHEEENPDGVESWRYEVANGDTQLGLADWLEHQADEQTAAEEHEVEEAT